MSEEGDDVQVVEVVEDGREIRQSTSNTFSLRNDFGQPVFEDAREWIIGRV